MLIGVPNIRPQIISHYTIQVFFIRTGLVADEPTLQPYFDKLLLIPGREITTFQGHFNLFGATQFLDFRLGSKKCRRSMICCREQGRLEPLCPSTIPHHPQERSASVAAGPLLFQQI